MLFPGDLDSPNGSAGTSSANEVAEDRRALWKQARELLSRARNVVLIGYSLPTYDQFAEGFLIEACRGKHVEVANPNPTDAKRIEKEIGASAKITLTLTRFEESEYANEWSQSTRQPNASQHATKSLSVNRDCLPPANQSRG